MHADHRDAIPILHVKYRAQFLLGVGWGGMSYWVYVTLSCHDWKRIDFRYSGAYFIHSVVYRTNVYWSVIHGIKRKTHLSVVWNWYHFVVIAILHQPRPMDSADINTRLQLSDTSSIPPMHGGFLLIALYLLLNNVLSKITSPRDLISAGLSKTETQSPFPWINDVYMDILVN